ncbi:SRPBCC family protein [Streptomyces sp. TRM64462]|uniref:SRPBCC family protein n=1 Tax=Streptomyces sp. TRM64462 TaxID=2741726 RepID=UPI001586DD5F|nr:SRPBCC family protein [Streptomyces sp. TRM64462]
MSTIKESVEIDRRPEEVYEYVADPSHLPEWQESAVAAHRVGEAPLGVGSRVSVTRQIGKRVMPMTLEITEYDPPRSWRMHGIEGPVRPELHGTIEPLDDGRRSRLTLDLNIEGHGLGKVLVPMVVRPFARKEMPNNEQTLKKLLEGGSV